MENLTKIAKELNIKYKVLVSMLKDLNIVYTNNSNHTVPTTKAIEQCLAFQDNYGNEQYGIVKSNFKYDKHLICQHIWDNEALPKHISTEVKVWTAVGDSYEEWVKENNGDVPF